MDGNSHAEDWMPLGWRVEIRVRKFGSKDKEEGKLSPHISTFFSCNSMDSTSTTSVEENHVIEQNVKIHSGDTPNISCILPKDEKTNTDEAALEISGKSAANNLQSMENGILHPSAETHCANFLEEDSAFKEALAVGLDQSSVNTSVRAAQSSSPVLSQKRNASHQNRAKSKVVQKCVAEGLPEGWTKEIKVTKKSGNVRKDPSPLTKKQKLAKICSSHRSEDIEDSPENVLPPSHARHSEGLPIPACAQDKREDNRSKLSKAVQQE